MCFDGTLREKLRTDLKLEVRKLVPGVCQGACQTNASVRRPKIITNLIIVIFASPSEAFIQIHENTFHLGQRAAHIDLIFRSNNRLKS